jgi:hypothetical protein
MPDFTDHIRQAVANNHYFLTDHATTQKDERGIKEQEIREVIGRGEVIERYPDAYPCPACLFMHEARPGQPLYVVGAYDAARQEARIVTIHWRDPDKWLDDWRTRRR